MSSVTVKVQGSTKQPLAIQNNWIFKYRQSGCKYWWLIFSSAPKKRKRMNCCQWFLKCSMKFNNKYLWSFKKENRKPQFLLGGRVNLLFFWISICLKWMVSSYNNKRKSQKDTVTFIHNSIYSHLICINNAAV